MVRIKICGIRTIEDAELAVSSGADAIGVLVGQDHPSPDFVSPEQARDIAASLPPFVASTLVTHMTHPAHVADLITFIRPGVVQIHSDMGPEAFKALKEKFPGTRFLKAYHVVDAGSLDYGLPYIDSADGFVLDTINATTGQVGGTGLTHDWALSASIVKRYAVPVILAGGLTPENVEEAIAQVNPHAVDVNSGVKGPDGLKDPMKVLEFVFRARRTLTAPARRGTPRR